MGNNLETPPSNDPLWPLLGGIVRDICQEPKSWTQILGILAFKFAEIRPDTWRNAVAWTENEGLIHFVDETFVSKNS